MKVPKIKKRRNTRRTNVEREFDYTDVSYLQRFMTQTGKIKQRKYTGNSASSQRALAQAIKRARQMALLPYTLRAE